MVNYLKILASSLLPLVLVAGCGPDTNNPSPTGGGTTSIDDLEDKVLDAICGNAVDCHTAETEADCRASSGIDMEQLKASVASGRVKYHPEKLEPCLAVFEDLISCSLGAVFTSNGAEASQTACKPVFEGTVADGGACAADEECISGECEATDPSCTEQCGASKCIPAPAAKPRAKIGEACMDFDCESGAYCQTDMMGMPTTCAALIAEGQPCTSLFSCKAPALCNLDFMTGMGTCKQAAAHGAACNPMDTFPCDRTDDRCDATSKTCVTRALPGAACTMSDDCVEFATCNTGKCTKKGLDGATCDPMSDTDQCLGSIDCAENGKCTNEASTVCP